MDIARKFREHEKGMRLLILYMSACTVYQFFSDIYSFYRIYLPFREAFNTSPSAPGENVFISSGDDNLFFWQILISILPVMLVTLIPLAAGTVGLFLHRNWGWWAASVNFT